MYKRQVKLQKFFCMFALIASVLTFAYSLGLVTDLYDSFYYAIPSAKNPDKSYVEGARIYYDIQDFNRLLMYVGLGLIILSLGLFLTNTQNRRRYYIGNYVATGVWSVAAVAAGVWCHLQVEVYKEQFLTTVNFDQLKTFAESSNRFYTKSTFWFDVHYVVLAVLVLAAGILIANVFWKVNLMRQEAALLSGSGVKSKQGVTAKI